MRVLSGGRFRSVASPGTVSDQYRLSACGANCIWTTDVARSAWTELALRVQINAAQLKYHPRFAGLVAALEETGCLEQLKRTLACKKKQNGPDEEGGGCLIPDGEDGGAGGGEQQPTVTLDDLEQELSDKCAALGNHLGLCKEFELAYTPFLRLVHDQNFGYDSLRQVNFSDGFCYEPAT
eukprot:7377165-Prymnesium_polylepis.1